MAQALYLEVQPYMSQLLHQSSCVLIWVLTTDSDILMIILDKPTDKASYRETSVI